MTVEEMNEYFGEPISSYPDSQAVEDGVLVAVTPKDRVTRACWEWLADKLGDSPPNQWPVELMGYIGAAKGTEGGYDRALAASKGLIGQYWLPAMTTWTRNINGGIFVLLVRDGDMTLTVRDKDAQESDENDGFTVLWLLPNEMDGSTLMFPSDY